MPMSAEEIITSRMQQEQQSLQQAFNQQWAVVNRRFGPKTRNPNVETARQRALNTLHSQFRSQADSLMRKYDSEFQSLREVDSMAEAGMISGVNLEELKLRTVLPQDIERAVMPEEEEGADPLAEYGKFDVQRRRVRRELNDFEVVGPRPAGTHSVDRVLPNFLLRKSAESFDDPGGVGNRVFKRQIAGYDENYEPVYERVPVKGDELRRWAELTEQERQLSEAMSDIMRSDPMAARIRMAATRSRRMMNAGTFANKAVGSRPEPSEPASKQLTPDVALRLYQQAGGDPNQARELARQEGYRF